MKTAAETNVTAARDAGAVSRRDFLKTGAGAGTALLIGFYLPGAAFADGKEKQPVNPLNAWVKIDRNGDVTLILAKSEMGQGVMTGLPMILAEELDVDWARIRVEQAPTNPAIYDHGTGGSGSISDSWMPLRQAGAAARQMLIAAAAKEWNVDPNVCHTKDGKVIHGPRKTVLTYGELVEAAAKLPVPDLEDVPLKNPSEFQVIGKDTPRTDTPEKTDGSAIFGIDVRVPGMVYAVIARCPAYGGKANRYNAEKAKAVAGVREVIEIPAMGAGAWTCGGIAVIAENTWAALQGRDALDVEWDTGARASESSEDLRRQFQALIEKPGEVVRNVGDVDQALAGGKTVEAVYEMPFLAHATMEPMNCTVDIRADRAEAWIPTQAPQWAQEMIAGIAKLPKEKVNVHTTLMGGGFGRRYHADFVVEAAQVSNAIHKPVQVLWTREDDMQHDFYRQATMQKLTATLDEKGSVAAWRHRVASTSIRVFWDGPATKKPSAQEIGHAAMLPYALPNFRVEYAYPNYGLPVMWWRSVEESMSGFTVESFIDELAHAAGADPLEFRLQLIGTPRKIANPSSSEDAPVDTGRFRQVLQLVSEKSGWGKPLEAGRGRGLATYFAFDTYVAQVAEVSVAKNGNLKVDRVVCAVDCGRVINPDQVRAQMESAVVYGLSAALFGEITVAGGAVKQTNFHDYRVARMRETPVIEVHMVASKADPTGMGEPGVPCLAPAVANAIFAATGKRIRRLPIRAADLA